jgi:hypothetical protein
MEQQIFFDFQIDVLLDIEAKLDSIINSIELLLTSGGIVNKDSLKNIKDKCEMHVECVKQISHLQNCKHEYITDTIDIDTEKSQMITYCIHCEHTL